MKDTKTFNLKAYLESQDYLQKKIALGIEINNQSRLTINRQEFTKTWLEREKLVDMKKSFRRLQKNPVAHKESRITFVKAILDAQTPNWGVCNVAVKSF